MKRLNKKDLDPKRKRKVKEPETASNYQMESTSDPDLFRVVDRDGEWSHYFDQPTNTYLPAVNYVIQNGFPKGQGLIEYFKRTPKEELEKNLRSAGGRGSKIHAAIRDLINGAVVKITTPYKDENKVPGVLKPDEWDCLLSWATWAKDFQPKAQTHETAVKNLIQKYAGTIDFRGEITIPVDTKVYIDDKLTTSKDPRILKDVLLDWKTGAAIYDEAKLQLAAYSNCGKLPEYMGIVRIGTSHKNGGYEMRLYSKAMIKYYFGIFLNSYSIFEMNCGIGGRVPITKEIPLSIEVIIPKLKSKVVTKKKKIITPPIKEEESK